MSAKTTDIHHASKEKPIVWKHEPGFRRIYARGTLLRHDQNRTADEPKMLHLSFWSNKEDNVPVDENTVATGYHLEVEAVMTWESARRMRDLLSDYLERHGAEEPPQPQAPAGDGEGRKPSKRQR